MSIASSVSIVGHAQKDGRAYVREEHTDHLGQVYRLEFGPVVLAAVDLEAIRAARAARLEELLAEHEYRAAIRQVAALSLQHQTAAQFATRMREDYRARSKAAACELSWWMIEMIGAAHVTDTQVRNAFGLTAQQWTNLKASKITPQHDAWAVTLAAQGE